MGICRYFALSLGLLASLGAADVTDLLQQAARAEARLDSRTALALLQQADALEPDNSRTLQRIARQYSDLVVEQPDAAARQRCATQALQFAQRAVALDPHNAVNVLSLAVCHGKLAADGDARTRVRYSRLVREEAERALALDPGYAWAHHVLGRWHCEVATLGPADRFFLQVFYGGLPGASLEAGVRELQRATELEPDELNHWLELGFACAAAGRPAEARRHWARGLALPSRGKHDEPAKARARAALARLE